MNSSSALKNDYLEAIGISQWYPRARLANAPESVVTEHFQENAEPAIQSEPLPGEKKATVNTPSIEDINVGVKTVGNLPSPQNIKQSNSPTIKFGLGLYVVGDWIIASSLTSDYLNNQDQALRLIQNVLATLDPKSVDLKYHHVISWPFFSNPIADQGIEAARDYISGAVQNLAEEYKLDKVVVFGGVLSKLNGWQSVEPKHDFLSFLVLPSLHKMLREPVLKARVWKCIQSSKLYSQ